MNEWISNIHFYNMKNLCNAQNLCYLDLILSLQFMTVNQKCTFSYFIIFSLFNKWKQKIPIQMVTDVFLFTLKLWWCWQGIPEDSIKVLPSLLCLYIYSDPLNKWSQFFNLWFNNAWLKLNTIAILSVNKATLNKRSAIKILIVQFAPMGIIGNYNLGY